MIEEIVGLLKTFSPVYVEVPGETNIKAEQRVAPAFFTIEITDGKVLLPGVGALFILSFNLSYYIKQEVPGVNINVLNTGLDTFVRAINALRKQNLATLSGSDMFIRFDSLDSYYLRIYTRMFTENKSHGNGCR